MPTMAPVEGEGSARSRGGHSSKQTHGWKRPQAIHHWTQPGSPTRSQTARGVSRRGRGPLGRLLCLHRHPGSQAGGAHARVVAAQARRAGGGGEGRDGRQGKGCWWQQPRLPWPWSWPPASNRSGPQPHLEDPTEYLA